MNLRWLLIFPPLAIGAIGYYWMTLPDETTVEPPEESAIAVRTMVVKPRPIAVKAVGYGRVEPEIQWSAISELQGRVATLADEVSVGSFVSAGQILVELDRTDYELSWKKAQANIVAAESRIAELQRSEGNVRKSLEVQEEILEVVQAEFDRTKSLVDRGASAQVALDNARRSLLSQQAAITDLSNNLALFPEQRASAEASLEVSRAALAEAERSLEKTTIFAPFDGRVSTVSVNQDRYVRNGEILFTIDSTSAVEIVAEAQPQALRPLFAVVLRSLGNGRRHVDFGDLVPLLKQTGVKTFVTLTETDSDAYWPAEIVRMRGATGSNTGTVGLVVRVSDPLRAETSDNRPPLRVGTFVSVNFETGIPGDSIAIPRDTVHYSDRQTTFVYLSDAEERLNVREVELGSIIGSEVLIRSGLEGGENLVLSDPRPAVPGLKLISVPVDSGSEVN